MGRAGISVKSAIVLRFGRPRIVSGNAPRALVWHVVRSHPHTFGGGGGSDPLTKKESSRSPFSFLLHRSAIINALNGAAASDRIEQAEQEQAGGKAADMRLPGDRLLLAGERDRAEPEQQIHAKPHSEKCQHARVLKNT